MANIGKKTGDHIKKFKKFFLQRPTEEILTEAATQSEDINPKYEQKVVAFVDILGIRDYMKAIKIESDDDARERHEKIIGISETFNCIISNSKLQNENISVMEISDSFVICTEIKLLNDIIEVLSELQFILLYRYKFLVRGAVAYDYVIGNVTSGKVIGKAFIQAHELENKNAIFPRIVIHESIKDEQINKNCFLTDFDGFRYIDFIVNYASKMMGTDITDEINTITKIIDDLMKSNNDTSIKQKYTWLKNYVTREHKIGAKNGN